METTAPTAERAGAPLPPDSPDGAGPASEGLSPLVVLAAAFVLGVLLARLLDWRTHAHPHG